MFIGFNGLLDHAGMGPSWLPKSRLLFASIFAIPCRVASSILLRSSGFHAGMGPVVLLLLPPLLDAVLLLPDVRQLPWVP